MGNGELHERRKEMSRADDYSYTAKQAIQFFTAAIGYRKSVVSTEAAKLASIARICA